MMMMIMIMMLIIIIIIIIIIPVKHRHLISERYNLLVVCMISYFYLVLTVVRTSGLLD